MDKQEINSYNVIGEMEACMHACPDKKIQGNLHDCPDFKEFYESELKKETNESL